MRNNNDFAAGFDWRRRDRMPRPEGRWLRDVVIALSLALMAALLLMAGEARAQPPRLLQVSGNDRTVMVSVAIGKSQDVRTDKSFVDVMVGDPEVADVDPLTDHSLSILAKKIGTTRVSVYAEGKKLIGIFDVEVTYDITRLTNELKRRFPGSAIEASTVNGRIMLSGEISDVATLDKAVTIARQFGPEIINSVSVMQPQQVMLEVRFIEISRNASRELGVQWNRFGGNSTINVGNNTTDLPITSSASATAAGVLSGATPFGFLLGRIVAGGTTTDIAINALEQKGIARSLAEPNLVALSGDTASFLAGGEYPIPISSQNGQVTVDYKKYGVGLAFTPTVLGKGLINLKIEPEVSQIDSNHSVQVSTNVSVPALTVRRASTTVELRDGQSFAIGGLLQSDNRNMIDQLPWIGNVPVLGALFASRSYLKNESDLVIIVTPRLVRPARPGDGLRTPADDSLAPNDLDFFLMGKTEMSPRQARALTPATARIAAAGALPFTGHMLDLPKRVSDAAIQ